jgi:DNA invertase Pin-like site-specific DNA recombinase
MMGDIESGLITRVIVYKLDRISRSILDFSSMMVKFEACRVEFVSSTEKFDTSSPMGRAMLNICIVFAQLERETIQKRVADAYFARSQKSFYMGGRIPYGFMLEPIVIDRVRTARYIINPKEVAVVRLIFEMYARQTTSYGDIVRYFQEHDIQRNGKPWERTRLADILKNPVYVKADLDVYEFFRGQGVIIANSPEDFIGTNGCYYYAGQDAQGRKHVRLEGNHLVLAPHEGIVDSSIWLACRKKCLGARQVTPSQKAKNTWLAGKIKCGKCGYALVDKHYSNKNARYLLCSYRMNSKACEGSGSIHTPEMEALIFEQMRSKLAEFKSLSKTSRNRANPAATAAQVELEKISGEISTLMGKLNEANETMFRYISTRIEELDVRKRRLETELAELMKERSVNFETLTRHTENWDVLSFDDRRAAVDQLIKVIHATSEKVAIEWRI